MFSGGRFGAFFGNRKWQMMLIILGIILLVVYVVLAIATIIMIKIEKMHFTPKMRVQAVLFNPIYLLTYIPCALRAVFTKNVKWKRIEYGRTRKR